MLHHSSRISPKTRFCLKLLLLILPLIPIVVVYFMFDPYRVLHPYKRFDDSPMLLNEAHVGWQNYLQNRDSIAYNSFILGNSCTMAFLTGEWEKYLDKNDHAVRFYDNGESLGGVRQKLQLLDSVGAPLKNILIVLDKKITGQKRSFIGQQSSVFGRSSRHQPIGIPVEIPAGVPLSGQNDSLHRLSNPT